MPAYIKSALTAPASVVRTIDSPSLFAPIPAVYEFVLPALLLTLLLLEYVKYFTFEGRPLAL
jgi:hypothetical protein